MYEQRRQEELRRQIRLKEQELEQISTSKQKFKDRIERTLGLNTSQNSIAPGRSSPLRHSTQVRESTLQTVDRERFPPVSNYSAGPDRSTSPLRGKSVEREPPVPFVTQKEQTFAKGTDYASQLFNDNQQLQRRLNLVVAELDRVTRDKQTQQNRLNRATEETESISRAIENEDRSDKHIHEKQTELQDEREQNRRVQCEIQRADTTRAEAVH